MEGIQALGRRPIAALDLVQRLDFLSCFVNKPLIPGFTLVSQAAICQNPLPYWESAASTVRKTFGRGARTDPVRVLETRNFHDGSTSLQTPRPDAMCPYLDLRSQPTEQSATRVNP